MIKIIHCADIHLDSPFVLEDVKKSEVRRNELRGAFTSMMVYAKMNNINLMVIAGDLFENNYITKDTVSLIRREFKNNPDCKFVISPGNHDPFTENSIYNKIEFSDNVYIFGDENLSYFSFDDIGVDVYGYAFKSNTMEINPFIHTDLVNTNHINILCAHGDLLSPISKYCPISIDDIENSKFDYVALGHVHNSTGINKIGNTYYGYSGCLEGRDFGETGYKGAIYIEAEKKDSVFSVHTKGIRFSKRKYELEHLDISNSNNMDDIIYKIKELLVKKKYTDDTTLRIYLEGNIDPSLIISQALITEQIKGLFALEIKDRTLPLYDYEYLISDPTIKGAFFECLLPMLTDGTAEERETAARALRYGLSAISGSDIIDF